MFRAKQESARRNIKTGIDSDESRKKREETSLTIRKSKREESLQKRRNFAPESSTASVSATETALHQLNTEGKIKDLPALVQGLYSPDEEEQLKSLTAFRKLLSIERNPPIDEVINAGIVPRIIDYLSHHHVPIQFEAAWVLTNIASGSSEQTSVVVNHGAIPKFVQLLSSSNEDLREQVVWALGNIAGDSALNRDLVLQAGALPWLLKQYELTPNKLSLLRNNTWTISNLCRGKPHVNIEAVAPVLPYLNQLINAPDEEVLVDTCWSLSYMSDGDNARIQKVIESGTIPKLIELMMHQSVKVQTPALRAIGNIVTGDDLQTQAIIASNGLSALNYLLTSSGKKNIKKEACWAVSNITAGNSRQIQNVLDANIFPAIIHHLGNSEFEVKKEAAWAISNACSGGSKEQVRYIISQQCLEPLCQMLDCKDAKTVVMVLETVENILKHGEDSKTGVNPYCDMIEEAGGVELLEKLQSHPSDQVYKKAVEILEAYYQAEEEVENMVPNVTPKAFSFAAPSGTPTTFSF